MANSEDWEELKNCRQKPENEENMTSLTSSIIHCLKFYKTGTAVSQLVSIKLPSFRQKAHLATYQYTQIQSFFRWAAYVNIASRCFTLLVTWTHRKALTINFFDVAAGFHRIGHRFWGGMESCPCHRPFWWIDDETRRRTSKFNRCSSHGVCSWIMKNDRRIHFLCDEKLLDKTITSGTTIPV
jgi:hypothetical protein